VAISSVDVTRNACIHQVFEVQAAATPDNIAVALGNQRLSYRELNERSNRVAHYLRKHGVGPDVFVGIYLDRTVELVVGLLGILKAGGTYVPIDPQYPHARLAFMLKDSRSPVIVTQRSLAADLTLAETTIICLDGDWPEISREAAGNPDTGVQQDHLAYVIYTSGSTGTPKGTLITHQNVVRLFQSTQAWFNFSDRDVWTLFHSVAFDFSVWELWGALFHGGCLIVVPFAVSRTPESFHRLLCEERVTVLNQTPSAFRQLIRADEVAGPHAGLTLRLVIFGGEALDFNSLKPWFDRHGDREPRLVNMYGITETTVHVTYRPINAEDLASGNSIGVPIPDLQIYLMDEQGNRVSPGVAGEIYVGGAGVGRGYLNRPELTSQKFISDPFSSEPGKKLYRSGDLARHLPNGDLAYLGRIDSQVKIRGFRIELGEISAALDTHPSVRESVVVVRDAPPDQKTLVAYLVKRPNLEVNIPEIRRMLRQRLPEYMVPSAFVWLERLPLTVNGKLDVKALPPPAAEEATVPGVPITAGTGLEQDIAAIWRDVLRVSAVGLDQNFFDVGGNSIGLAQVHDRLQKLLNRPLSITDFFAYPTIQSLASRFSSAAKPESGAIVVNANLVRAQRQREAMLAQRNVRREKK
jgi:amino acid adenylation domain-containing protein